MRHLTNREIWGKIQEWGIAEKQSHCDPTDFQCDGPDFVGQLLDPQEAEKARKEQLAKLWAKGACYLGSPQLFVCRGGGLLC
jgi:hypothetical protein